MSADSVRTLLNLPAGVRQPHAYHVFGLNEGEQSEEVIRQGIQATIERLRTVRGSTDPAVWNQAALVVQQARGILTDPAKKAELDARFGIIAVAEDDLFEDDLNGPETSDPLAGLLPNANPLAPSPIAPPAYQTSVPAQPPVPGHDPFALAGSSVQSSYPNATVAAAAEPQQDPGYSAPRLKQASYRRRRSILPTLMMGTFILAMLSIAGALVYFTVFGPGELAITAGEGGLKITSGKQASNDPTTVSPPGERPNIEPRRPADNIMGNLGPASSTSKPQSLGEGDATVDPGTEPGMTNPGQGGDGMAAETMPSDMMEDDMMGEEMMGEEMMDDAEMVTTPVTVTDPNMSETPATEPAVPMTPETPPAPPEPPTPPPPDPEMIQAGLTAIEQARTAVRAANWASMKELCEKAVAAAVTDDQREDAEAMFELVDLADFYRGGIVRAIAGFEIGNTFNLTDSLPVIVVETGPDKLAVRFNAQTKSYKFNELPLVLAHKLAAFHITLDATGIAAKAAYQAITPVSTPPHRAEAIKWLGELDEEVAGADPKRVAEAIDRIYGS